MKDDIFGSGRLGCDYNTEELQKLLKEEFGEDMKLSDVEFPRYYSCAISLLVLAN